MYLHPRDMTEAELAAVAAKNEKQAIFAKLSEHINAVKLTQKKFHEAITAARTYSVGQLWNSKLSLVAETVRSVDPKINTADKAALDRSMEVVQLVTSIRDSVDNESTIDVRHPASFRNRPFEEAPVIED